MPHVHSRPSEPSAVDLSSKSIVIFFLIAFLVLFAGYGLREPWPADEPRFVLVAKQMFDSGQWLFPHRGIELYPDKPPVYFWLLGMAYAVIGSWRWSFLLPSLISGMTVLWLVFDLGKRLWNPRSGLWAAAAVLVSVQFVYQFKRAQIDPTLVLMTTASFYFLARHVLLERRWTFVYAGFALAGLGVITKGVGFLPLLAVLPLAAYRRAGFSPMTAAVRHDGWRWLAAFGFFLLPIALWLAAIMLTSLNSGSPEQAEYLRNILFKQTAERYANPWHHHEPFWYFIEIIGLFWAPFSLAFFWLFKPWRDAISQRDLKPVFALAWGLLVVLFFSISAGKRDMYILPALPAFALAAAPYLQAISQRVGFRRAVMGFLLVLGSLLLLAGLAAEFGKAGFAKDLVAERGLGAEARWLWHMLTACGAVMLLTALIGGSRRILHSTALSLGLLWLSYGFLVHPILDASSSGQALMERARERAGGREIGLVAWKEQNLLQAQGPVADFGYRKPDPLQLALAIEWMQRAPQTRVLMVMQSPKLSCIEFGGPGSINLERANRRSWWLVEERAVQRCNPAVLSLQP